MILLTFDFVLVTILIWLSWRAMTDPDLLRAVVQFIIVGLLMAVAWVRLNAADVALAEAAVGSGLTGALILSAWARKREYQKRQGLK